ncbi:MAG: hypothetical protein JO111_06795 [Caulobacteraceae bacterium]|nr:hypothetical protein [Caulobacteraceae bacterium]
MTEITGVVVIVQEGRIEVMGDDGDGHLLILSPSAAAETAQLRDLEKRQARVRVTCSEVPNLVALKADRIEVLDEEATS